MLEYQERYGSIYLVDKDNGEIFNEITEPAVLFDRDVWTVLKIGNKAEVEQYYKVSIDKCKATGSTLFESFVYMDLPKNADTMNKIFHHTGYLQRFLQSNGIISA